MHKDLKEKAKTTGIDPIKEGLLCHYAEVDEILNRTPADVRIEDVPPLQQSAEGSEGRRNSTSPSELLYFVSSRKRP